MTTTTTTTRRTITAAALAVGVLAASYGAAAGLTVSMHGNDFSWDRAAYQGMTVCDEESDSNVVKGGYSLSVNGGESGSVSDNDGRNNVCGYGGTSSGTIKRHHTCERNFLTWNCGNWQRTTAPA